MNREKALPIQQVREFNRFYTNVLGLLDQHVLNSDFSLAEARVLYEIGHTMNCTAKKMTQELRMDRGYLSRLLKRLEKDGLILRTQSEEDGRLFYLHLTDQGRDILSKLGALSDHQIDHMLQGLSAPDRESILESMKTIRAKLTGKTGTSRENVNIRSDLKPGDAGWLIHLHGWIYAGECGYDHRFEGYVCKTLHHFLENYSPEKDGIWFAEADGKSIGAIAIMGHTAEQAQLRWFILHPGYRGIGLGKTLMNKALAFCKSKGYRQVFLETTQDQKTAIGMYEKAGFRKMAEHENILWGRKLIEQKYQLELSC